MDVANGAVPAMAGSASENLRPHCLAPEACVAKSAARHCPACTARSPECRARRRAAATLVRADPVKLARKQAAARRVAADAEITARKSAAMKASYEKPEVRRRHRAACMRASLKRMENPAEHEKCRELGLRLARWNSEHVNAASARRVEAIRKTHLAWCPPEYWDENKRLKRAGYRLSDRMQIIGRQVEDAELARLDHELAAAHLRRLAPIVRCDDRGQPERTGSHWRYGTRVLPRIEVIRLAVQKGAQPEALAA